MSRWNGGLAVHTPHHEGPDMVLHAERGARMPSTNSHIVAAGQPEERGATKSLLMGACRAAHLGMRQTQFGLLFLHFRRITLCSCPTSSANPLRPKHVVQYGHRWKASLWTIVGGGPVESFARLLSVSIGSKNSKAEHSQRNINHPPNIQIRPTGAPPPPPAEALCQPPPPPPS